MLKVLINNLVRFSGFVICFLCTINFKSSMINMQNALVVECSGLSLEDISGVPARLGPLTQ